MVAVTQLPTPLGKACVCRAQIGAKGVDLSRKRMLCTCQDSSGLLRYDDSCMCQYAEFVQPTIVFNQMVNTK